MQTSSSFLRQPGRALGRRRRRIALPILAATLLFVPAAGSAQPDIALDVSGVLGAEGWYTSSVTVSWNVSDPTGISGSTGCGTTLLENDTAGTTLTCTASSVGPPPVTSTVSVVVKIDRTGPEVAGATPERGPDSNGWYRQPVSFAFAGTDTLSGIASCSSVVFSSSAGGPTSVTGSCTDKAGNTATRSVAVAYDATAPQVVALEPERAPDRKGWYNHPVTFSAAGTDDASGIASCGSVTYSGPDTDDASLTAICLDRAGNSGTGAATLRYDATPPRLIEPRVVVGEGVTRLRWQSSADSDVVRVVRRARGRSSEKVVFHGVGRRFDDRTVENGVEYRYLLRSRDLAGNRSRTRTLLALPRVLPLRGSFGRVP